MKTIQGWIISFYNFLVGDMRILLGSLLALAITWLLAGVAPALAGFALVLMIVATLAVAIWREVTP